MEPNIRRLEQPVLRPASRPGGKRGRQDAEDEHAPFELDRNQDAPEPVQPRRDAARGGVARAVVSAGDDEVGTRIDLSA